jgi:uncharacterized protein
MGEMFRNSDVTGIVTFVNVAVTSQMRSLPRLQCKARSLKLRMAFGGLMRRVWLGLLAGLLLFPAAPRAQRRPWFFIAFPRALLVIGISTLSSTMALSGFDEGVTDYRAGNYKNAFKEWTEAAQDGDPDAQYNIGCLYVRGEGVPKNLAWATDWFQRAADQGDIDAATWLLFANPLTDDSRKKYFSAKYKPSDKFHITFVGQRSDGKITRRPCKTDEKDGAEIEFETGLMFENGLPGYPKNDKQAAEWYRKASDRNFAEAQTHLAYMYTDGRGVEKNQTEAGQLFRRAAEQGNARAQAALGLFYANGSFGFAKDPVLGYALISHAADAGDELGRNCLSKVVALMSVEQFSKGQTLAKEWKANAPWPPKITERMRSLDSALARLAPVLLGALGTLLFMIVIVIIALRIEKPRANAGHH